MLLFHMDGREIAAVATSLAIAVSEGLTERQVTALASFFAVLGQSLGAIASGMAGTDVITGGSPSSSAIQTSAGSGSGNETTAGYTAVTGVKVSRDIDATPAGMSEWYYRTSGATGAASQTSQIDLGKVMEDPAIPPESNPKQNYTEKGDRTNEKSV